MGPPPRRAAPRHRRPGFGLDPLPGAPGGRRVPALRRVPGLRRRPAAVHLHLAPLLPAAARGNRPHRAARRDPGAVGGVGLPVHVPRPVAGRGGPLADHAEGADVPPHRRDRRRAHHLPARAPRRGAELGLPVLLAAGRRDDPRGAHQHRVPGGGGRLARLADPGRGRPPRGPPGRVRRGGRTAAARADPRLAPRVRELPPGADRQRRGRAGPARRLRADAQRALRGAPARPPPRTTTSGR